MIHLNTWHLNLRPPPAFPNLHAIELKTENQPDSKSWSQTRSHPEDPPPAKRPKPSGEPPPGQQLAPLPPGASSLSALLSSAPHLQRSLPRLQARTGGSSGGSGAPHWGLGHSRSLARRIVGKERLAVHLRQRVVSERGDTELLSVQESREDIQMDLSLLADHIMEATSERLKQEPMETEVDSRGAGLSSDVTALSGCLSDVERFLHPGPPSPLPRLSSLSGEQPPQPCPSELRFFCGFVKENRPKSPRPPHGPIQEQRKEIAAVIQRCYKRYKQYALYKRMTLAAVLIQSRFRSLIEQKKFQQSKEEKERKKERVCVRAQLGKEEKERKKEHVCVRTQQGKEEKERKERVCVRTQQGKEEKERKKERVCVRTQQGKEEKERKERVCVRAQQGKEEKERKKERVCVRTQQGKEEKERKERVCVRAQQGKDEEERKKEHVCVRTQQRKEKERRKEHVCVRTQLGKEEKERKKERVCVRTQQGKEEKERKKERVCVRTQQGKDEEERKKERVCVRAQQRKEKETSGVTRQRMDA
ncbi:hypothetical protein WMY93_033046 [Mugilogobius chulae]|uniref:Uncharacterized protein n=1 Tax=Mugilogobius chulae TaxID=88201 RepID=A0AAW0MT22_9GOBI